MAVPENRIPALERRSRFYSAFQNEQPASE